MRVGKTRETEEWLILLFHGFEKLTRTHGDIRSRIDLFRDVMLIHFVLAAKEPRMNKRYSFPLR